MTILEKIRAEIEQEFRDIGMDGTYEWNIIQEAFDRYAEQEPTDEWQNGYDMAWEEAKVFYEKEPCDDVISREWLKTAIHNFYYGLKHTPTEEDIQAYIDVAPSVRPQEQTGHWIYTDYHTWCCSECGGNPHKGTGFVPNKDGMKMRWKYCNLCGAKMFEPQESEEGGEQW